MDKPVTDIRRWGPAFWDSIMSVALLYPLKPLEIDKSNMYNFLASISKVLPCGICRSHFQESVREQSSPTLNSRQNLVLWLFEIQNGIRIRQRRGLLSFEQFISKYRGRIHWQNIAIL